MVEKFTFWSGIYWFLGTKSLILLLIFTTLTVYLVRDYRGPLEIPLQQDYACGLTCLKADDLLVQGHDIEGNLWATRGMIAYRLSKGDSKFIRQYHVPTGFSIFWLRNFSIVRHLTLRPEAVELLPMPKGEACVMSAGRMWYRPPNGKDFQETLILPYYGIRHGQGVRNDGLVRLTDGTILLGESFLNKNRTNSVKIYSSENNGRTWQTAHEFQPGQIRHIHAIQQDPYTGKVWICTGDLDSESIIAWSSDGAKTFNSIGQESQIWRAFQLVFTKDALYWGTDTGSSKVSRGIYRWDRTTEKLTQIVDVSNEMFYATRLANGTIVMSTTCTGAKSEKDNKTRLKIVTDGKNVTSLVCGTRDSSKKYAKLRFQRDQGASSLYITSMNHKESNDADLIIISEEELRMAAESVHIE